MLNEKKPVFTGNQHLFYAEIHRQNVTTVFLQALSSYLDHIPLSKI